MTLGKKPLRLQFLWLLYSTFLKYDLVKCQFFQKERVFTPSLQIWCWSIIKNFLTGFRVNAAKFDIIPVKVCSLVLRIGEYDISILIDDFDTRP